jgi:hypothetical protein
MGEPKAGRNGEPGATGPSRNGRATGEDRTVRAGDTQRYLVAARPQPRTGPLDGTRLAELLAAQPQVQVVDRIGEDGPAPGAWPPGSCPAVLVVEAPPAVAAGWLASGRLLVEPDSPLAYTHPNPIASAFTAADPAVLVTAAEPRQLTLVVRGTDEVPLPGAAVYLTGAAWPAAGVTDSAGRVTLPLPASGTVTGLWVRPRTGYWPVTIDRPELSADSENIVVATPLDATFDGFPKRKAIGWAQQALRLHEIAPTFRGHGVRLALIDSGVAEAHPDLDGQLAGGIDLVAGTDRGWAADPLGHGTACAGIIGASDDDSGVDGVAVDAEVHILKVMPGGRVSHLLKALDHCVRQQIDVAQISVGTLTGSDLVALKIADAREAGVLCVAPAGNTGGGPVTFPASLPTVLAVGAVGRVGSIAAGSHHPADLGPPVADGMFVPGFTAAGYEVDVCAPGVAVLCTVPPDGYAMLDGTGIAAAHVTALAGLVLAHHDDFQARYPRGAARVDRLAQLISTSCRPVEPVRVRTGAGVPDARCALAPVEPVPPDWASAVLSQLYVDLARVGLVVAPTPGRRG